MKKREKVLLGIVGSHLDSGFHKERWEKWRPTVSLHQQPDLKFSRCELIHSPDHKDIAACVAADIRRVSEGTQTFLHEQQFKDPWDLEEVYASLYDFTKIYGFEPDQEDYYIHITTGTHIQQIALFLLTESRHFPGRLIQASPKDARKSPDGTYRIIDLNLSTYDKLASRFASEVKEAHTFLKSGIETKNRRFNALIEQIEHVAIASRDPILLMGPTGAGKSQLAKRIYELKKFRHKLSGTFVEVNCATLRGDSAMSTLFGHVKGSFTGALKDRPGLLRSADGGLLFLDEIGELGSDEQAMLLRALEEKCFTPFGADKEVTSDFQLIAGTNRDLAVRVQAGTFRDDLLARINLWTYQLPGLRDRSEDIEPNLDYELERYATKNSRRVTMSKEVREHFLEFARSSEATWSGNFRDLNASVTRMATLAIGGRIGPDVLEAELTRLRHAWKDPIEASDNTAALASILSEKDLAQIDTFDRVQLNHVISICQKSHTLSEAGRQLFNVTRTQRKITNDADRLRKYLARFHLDWEKAKRP